MINTSTVNLQGTFRQDLSDFNLQLWQVTVNLKRAVTVQIIAQGQEILSITATHAMAGGNFTGKALQGGGTKVVGKILQCNVHLHSERQTTKLYRMEHDILAHIARFSFV